MDKKSKILLIVFLLVVIGSIAASYYRFMVKRDYIIEAQMDCDPYAESCFTWECDPETEGECTGNPEEDTWYYKLVRRNAMHIPECDPAEEGCEVFVCPEGESECEEIVCSADILAEREEEGVCTDPEQYAIDNPIEEEVADEEEAPEEEGDESLEGAESGASEEDEGAVPEESSPEGDTKEPPASESVPESAADSESAPTPSGKVVPLTINGKTIMVTLPSN